MTTVQASTRNSSISRRPIPEGPFASLPNEVIEVIIVQVGPHLGRLSAAAKRLWILCEPHFGPFLANLKVLNVELTSIPEQSSALRLVRELGLLEKHLPGLTVDHAGQKLAQLASFIAVQRRPQLNALTYHWQKILELSLQMSPDQTALALVSMGNDPLYRQLAGKDGVCPAVVFKKLEARSPQWAKKVEWAWQAEALQNKLNAGKWITLLETVVKDAPLPPWLSVAVMKSCAAVAWHADFNLLWIRLIAATSDPASACKAFICSLEEGKDGDAYLQTLREYPQAQQYMCMVLANICKAHGDRADIIVALCRQLVEQMGLKEQRASIAILYPRLSELSVEYQGEPAAAMLAFLNGSEARSGLTTDQLLELLSMFCTLQKPEVNSFQDAVAVAGELPDSDWRIALALLLKRVKACEPELQADIWFGLSDCISQLSRKRAPELVQELLSWDAASLDEFDISLKLPILLKEVLRFSCGPERQAALLSLVHFLPEQLMPELQSNLRSLQKHGLLESSEYESELDDAGSEDPVQELCNDLLQVAAQYQSELSASSKTLSQKAIWNKPLVIWQSLARLLPRLKNADYACDLFGKLIAHAKTVPQNLAPRLIRELAADVYRNGKSVLAGVIALIIGLHSQKDRHALLVGLGRTILKELSTATAKKYFEQVMLTAEHCGLEISQVLLDIVPNRREAEKHRGLCVHSLLLPYAQDARLGKESRIAFITKMIDSWYPLRSNYAQEHSERVSRFEYLRLLKRIDTLDREDRPELLLALARKLTELNGKHRKIAAAKLRSSAAGASQACRKELSQVLKRLLND